MTFVIAAGWGAWVMVGFVLVLFVGGSWSYYLRHKRMDISQHPRGAGKQESPGVGEGASRLSSAAEDNEGVFDSRGTR